MNKSWYVYIVECADTSFYTGVTTDVEARVHAHNHESSGAKYTRARRPVFLVYSQEYSSRSEAQKEESRIKKLSKIKKIELLNL